MAQADNDNAECGPQESAELRGAIDRFEEHLAVIVFDDGQQVDLPRADLPFGAQAGDAVIARICPDGPWHGVWHPGGAFVLDGGQALQWPAGPDAGEGWLRLEIDDEDTAIRRRRVKGLLDDLFSE